MRKPYEIQLPMQDNMLVVMISSEPLFMSDFQITLQLSDRDLMMLEDVYKKCNTETQRIIALNDYLNCIKYEYMTDAELGLVDTFELNEEEEE